MAKRCGVKARLWDETAAIEERVLPAVLSKSYERMTEEQRQKLLAALKIQRLPGVGGPDVAGDLRHCSPDFSPCLRYPLKANLRIPGRDGNLVVMLPDGWVDVQGEFEIHWLLFGNQVKTQMAKPCE
jgi:hypothetical protein